LFIILETKINTIVIAYYTHLFKAKICKNRSQAQWLKPVILATGKMKIRKTVVQGKYGQKFLETASQPIKVGHGGICLSF
jgi:hypothetical protein